MKYRILYDNDTHGLQKKVIEYLKDGWELSGGVSMGYNPKVSGLALMFAFAQAVIKKDDEENG